MLGGWGGSVRGVCPHVHRVVVSLLGCFGQIVSGTIARGLAVLADVSANRGMRDALEAQEPSDMGTLYFVNQKFTKPFIPVENVWIPCVYVVNRICSVCYLGVCVGCLSVFLY